MRRFLRYVTPPRALVATLALLAGAAVIDPGAALNLFARAQSYRLLEDVAYGAGPRAKLDVYLPERVDAAKPLVVFFYGGRWSSGEKAQYRFVGAALAARGAIAVIPDYSLYPQTSFPVFLEDAARALRWARDNAGQLGADRSRIFLMGHSAGGHIAAMLAFDKRWLAAVGLSPAKRTAPCGRETPARSPRRSRRPAARREPNITPASRIARSSALFRRSCIFSRRSPTTSWRSSTRNARGRARRNRGASATATRARNERHS
ncbi:MAG: alpha/beta hydrolase [Methylocystis sp.]